MRRLALRSAQVLVDFLVLSLALVIAFAARFDGRLDDEMLKRLVFALPYVVGFQYLVLLGFGCRGSRGRTSACVRFASLPWRSV
ncbi:MAG: hypothetical protein IPI67_19495 [Myxococcales bacterium]|nr:hypothetical protein [Myxococcales bacterium]